MTIGGCHRSRHPRTVAGMDTRTLGYIGLGVLVGIVLATLIGLPPFVWITAAIVTLVVTAAMAMGLVAGSTDAARVLGREAPTSAAAASEPAAPELLRATDVEMELVRPADLVERIPAVWLHRRGGRRVHRYRQNGGWVVERVSTKDPDNPKRRVIGESLMFVSEAEAVVAADDLARGNAAASPFPDRPQLAVAEF